MITVTTAPSPVTTTAVVITTTTTIVTAATTAVGTPDERNRPNASSLPPALTEDVLAAARQGSEDAFAVIWRKLSPVVHGYLATRGAADPEALTSDVFLAVLPRLHELNGGVAGLRTFVFSVAHARAGDPRTVGQLRSDTLVELILGRSGGSAGAAERGAGRGGASVQVTIALSTLTGLDEQPGELAGYGPIPASMARRIAAQPDSVWRRLVTDDLGRLIDYGRTTYRPPAALADFVRAWDQRCVFPTCHRRARDCDLDHLTAWRDHGQTQFDNLATECPRHHQVKHDADWTVQRLPDGTIQWTSPTGHTYHRPLDPLPIDRTTELINTDPDPPPF